jgi:hypothetical protein
VQGRTYLGALILTNMVNRWLDDEWSGPDGAHALLLDAGLADLCVFKPQGVSAIEDCQAYVTFDVMTAAQLGVEITKDQAVVQLLKKKADGTLLPKAPVNGDELVFPDLLLTVVSRTRTEGDLWVLLCRM